MSAILSHGFLMNADLYSQIRGQGGQATTMSSDHCGHSWHHSIGSTLKEYYTDLPE